MSLHRTYVSAVDLAETAGSPDRPVSEQEAACIGPLAKAGRSLRWGPGECLGPIAGFVVSAGRGGCKQSGEDAERQKERLT